MTTSEILVVISSLCSLVEAIFLKSSMSELYMPSEKNEYQLIRVGLQFCLNEVLSILLGHRNQLIMSYDYAKNCISTQLEK